MDVLDVLEAKRSDVSLASGEFQPWKSGRLYVSADKSELIALFDEPPAAPGQVLGMWRLLRRPPGSIAAAPFKAAVEKKYGEPAELEKHDASDIEGLKFIWSEHAPTNGCDKISRYNIDRTKEVGDWVSKSGTDPGSPQFGRLDVPSWNDGGNYLGASDQRLDLSSFCPAILGIEYATRRNSNATFDEVLTWLYDERAYVKLYYQSIDMADQVQPATETGSLDIKF